MSKTNKDRAARAGAALLAHQTKDCCGSSFQARAEIAADPEAVLSYLLSDLRHWADEKGLDFGKADCRAYGNYSVEMVEARREREAREARKQCWCKEKEFYPHPKHGRVTST